MLFIKDSVTIDHFSIYLLEGLLQASLAFQKLGKQMVVTSLSDSKHMDNSLHYRGYAADLRSRDIPVQDVPILVRNIQSALGHNYQVVLESDHIHIEYDPQHDGGRSLP